MPRRPPPKHPPPYQPRLLRVMKELKGRFESQGLTVEGPEECANPSNGIYRMRVNVPGMFFTVFIDKGYEMHTVGPMGYEREINDYLQSVLE